MRLASAGSLVNAHRDVVITSVVPRKRRAVRGTEVGCRLALCSIERASSVTPGRYVPEAGDLIWTDFDPRVGREQRGRRPVLVVSPADFCRVTEFAIVCPITSRVRPFGTSVVLPLGLPISGEILTSHVRSIDTLARPIS